MEENHKAGFVTIVGKPNAGKSTLMNKLVGEKLSIITKKAQTTRHRIMGIISGENYQIVYSDTPGILKPAYKLQDNMMTFVKTSLEDADVMLLVIDIDEKYEEELFEPLRKSGLPILLLLNKIDLAKGTQAEDKLNYWKETFKADDYLLVSALEGTGVDKIIEKITNLLPNHPAYFSKESLTDKSERFFAAEIVREKIFTNYKQEIPYSSQVEIEEFKETDPIIRIRAIIYVERKSQKGIIIGKGGQALKKVGIEARQDLEAFFGKKIYLETHVKILDDWRKDEQALKKLGY